MSALAGADRDGEKDMSEENKRVVRDMCKAVWDAANPDAAEQYFADDVRIHDAPPGIAPGIEGLKQLVRTYTSAFSGFRVHIDDEVAEGDRVAYRMHFTGMHTGELMGMEPTGKDIDVTGFYTYQVKDGKITDRWGLLDRPTLMQQLGK